jgi:Fe-S cluster assembly protein SufB
VNFPPSTTSRYYYAAPKEKVGPSPDEVDPDILEVYKKLGIPLREQEVLAGVEGAPRYAVDAVFDSVSVVTTFKAELAKVGIIFMPISEALREHPELVRKYLGSVVPVSDNYFAALNSAVFSDGSFVYIPPGVRCPMELSTYFRINASQTGQFERTLIIADKGVLLVSGGLHRPDARREPAARGGGRTGRAGRRRDQIFDGAELVPRRRGGQGRDL